MKAQDLKPAHTLALKYGVKTLCYGGPGSGKTPLINTAPRPVLCVVEPGMLSMRKSAVPCWPAFTADKIAEFFNWIFNAPDAKNFDTIGIDSISQMAEIILTDELKKNKDGRKAYGEMSRKVMDYVNGLYFLQNKHVYLIAKQATTDENGTIKKRPYFPGQDLNIKIPHLYDEILQLGQQSVPGMQGATSALRCNESFDAIARDRSGKLNEFEQPELTRLFNKCMG